MSRFIWYDLLSSDLAGAKAFYSDIIGWTTEKFPGGDYDILKAGGQGVGGIMALPAEMKRAGVPQHWMGYVHVDDVDATAQKAQKLGGKVMAPPGDIPTVGRYAVLADPQGAVFALFKPLPRDGGKLAPRELLGNFSWAELNTTDWKSAWKFYSELFGWKATTSMNMGPEFGEYFMFGTDAQQSMGGMSNAANMMKAPAHWLHYINVKSADETARRITEKGGKVLNGPMDVPGGDRIAQCMDPQGGVFAIFSAGKRA